MKKLLIETSFVFFLFTGLLSGMSDPNGSADSPEFINEVLSDRQRLLSALAEYDSDAVQLLLENGALCVNLSALISCDNGFSYSYADTHSIAAQLLKFIKLLHAKSDYKTANKVVDCARLLIAYGASIDIFDDDWPALAELIHVDNPLMWLVINDKKDTLLVFLMLYALLDKNYALAYMLAQQAYKRAGNSRRIEKFKRTFVHYKNYIQNLGYTQLLEVWALLEEEALQGAEDRDGFEKLLNSPEFLAESARYTLHELSYILELTSKSDSKRSSFLDLHAMLLDACLYAASHFHLACLKLLIFSLKDYNPVIKKIIPALVTRWRLNTSTSKRVLEWLLLLFFEKQPELIQDNNQNNYFDKYYLALYEEVFKNKNMLLSKAAGAGCIALVKNLLQEYSRNLLVMHRALDSAVAHGQLACTRQLLIHGACASDGNLNKAITQRTSALVQMLLEHGAGGFLCFPTCTSIPAYSEYIATLTRGERKIHRLLIAYGGVKNHISFAKRALGKLLFKSKSLSACLGNNRVDLFMFVCVHNLLKGEYTKAYEASVLIRKYVDFKNPKIRSMLDKLRGRLNALLSSIKLSPNTKLYTSTINELLSRLCTYIDFPHCWLEKAYYDIAAHITIDEFERRAIHEEILELTYEQAQRKIDACLVYALGQTHRAFVELLLPSASSQGIRDALGVANSIIKRLNIVNINNREYESLRNLLENRILEFYKRFFIGKKTEPSVFSALPDELLIYILRLVNFSSI